MANNQKEEKSKIRVQKFKEEKRKLELKQVGGSERAKVAKKIQALQEKKEMQSH